MKAILKLHQYEDRLKKWQADKSQHSHVKEPTPESFGLTSMAEKAMARQIRDQVVK